MEWIRIGDVARRTGLTARTLRHYDDLGLLVPSGRSGADYRLYAPADLRRLLEIQHLKSLGLSLDEIAAALDDPAFDAAATLARHIDLVEARISTEQDLLARLRRLQGAAGAGWEEVIDVIALTERLRHPDAAVRFRATLDAPAALSVDELLGVLRRDPEPGVREVATWAIVQHGEEALDAVVGHLNDPDPGVRRQLAHVLGKFADQRASSALAGLLADPDADVAAKAAFALGQVGGARAASQLAGVLGRGGAILRASVVTALGRLGEDAVGPSMAALGASEASVRADAAEALGHAADRPLADEAAVVDALTALVDDVVEEVRLSTLMALGSIGTDAARAVIEACLGHPDARTRLLASRLVAD